MCPITLAQGALLSNDVVLSGLLDLTIKDNTIFSDLMFDELLGTAFSKNIMTVEPTVDHYLPNEPIAEDDGTWSATAVGLKIALGDADIDEFMQRSYANVQDLRTAIMTKKLKAMIDKMSYMMIYGCEATYCGLAGNTRYPVGLRKLIGADAATGNVMAAGATGAALTLDMLDQLIDMVQGGPPTHLLMNKNLRRKIKSLARAAGTNLTVQQGRLGQQVEYYGTAKICINDYMLQTHTLVGSAETTVLGAASGTIYALRLDEDGFRGRINGGGILHRSIGPLESKDAERERFKCYYNYDVLNPISCAALIGAKVS
jgi:hypothetical protein